MAAKEKEVAISSVTLKIGAREITLSVDEAKNLKRALEELFGKNVIREVVLPRTGRAWAWGSSNLRYQSNMDDFVAQSLRGGSEVELCVK